MSRKKTEEIMSHHPFATKASVNAPRHQLHHLSDYVAVAGTDVSSACHPPSLPILRVYDFKPNIHGWKRPRGLHKTSWTDSIKHDLHSAGLNTTNAAQMIFDQPGILGIQTWEKLNPVRSLHHPAIVLMAFSWSFPFNFTL